MIESEPDIVSSSSDEEVVKKLPEKPKDSKKQLTKKEQEERLKQISQVKIGFKEYLQVLDYRMLGIFFKSIFYYFIFSFFLCGLYLLGIYHFNKAMWYEYFPIQDLSDITENEFHKVHWTILWLEYDKQRYFIKDWK